MLHVMGVQLPATAPAAVRAGLAALALSLYECVADNDRHPAARSKVHMVNRLLVQKYHSPNTVSLTARITNAELLARVIQVTQPEIICRFDIDSVSFLSIFCR